MWMCVLASGAALKFMGNFSFGSQQFWKLNIIILHNSYQECCAPKSSPRRCRPWWGEAAVCSQERFQGLRIGTSWGKLLVLCLMESLNSSDPLCKVVIVMKTSLESGDPAPWTGLGHGMPWEVIFAFVGGMGWIITPTWGKAKECIWSQACGFAILSIRKGM